MATETNPAGTNNTGDRNDDAPCITFDARDTLTGAYDDAFVAQTGEANR